MSRDKNVFPNSVLFPQIPNKQECFRPKKEISNTGYMATWSRTVGQGRLCKNRSQFNIVTYGRTDGLKNERTKRPRCKVACRRLKKFFMLVKDKKIANSVCMSNCLTFRAKSVFRSPNNQVLCAYRID